MNTFFHESVTKEIDSRVRTLPPQKLTARYIANIYRPSNPLATKYEYYFYTEHASIEAFMFGQASANLPIVGERGGKVSHDGYKFGNQIMFTMEEYDLMNASAKTGLRPKLPDQLDRRLNIAKNAHIKAENSNFFLGNTKYNMKGLLNFSEVVTYNGVTKTYAVKKEDVAEGSTGATAAARKSWANKTDKEIELDIQTAYEDITGNLIDGQEFFVPNTLIIPSKYKARFTLPKDSANNVSLFEIIQKTGLFQNIYFMNEVSESYTKGILKNDSNLDTDCFCMLDNRSEILELGILREITPEYRFTQTNEVGTKLIPVLSATGGCMLYFPQAVYVGTAI